MLCIGYYTVLETFNIYNKITTNIANIFNFCPFILFIFCLKIFIVA